MACQPQGETTSHRLPSFPAPVPSRLPPSLRPSSSPCKGIVNQPRELHQTTQGCRIIAKTLTVCVTQVWSNTRVCMYQNLSSTKTRVDWKGRRAPSLHFRTATTRATFFFFQSIQHCWTALHGGQLDGNSELSLLCCHFSTCYLLKDSKEVKQTQTHISILISISTCSLARFDPRPCPHTVTLM